MMKGMIIMKLKNIMNDDVMKATFTGVIATIIVTWIITPLANHIFPAILSLLNSFSSSFSDYLYRCMSYRFPGSTGSSVLLFTNEILYFLLFFSFFTFDFFISKHLRNSRKRISNVSLSEKDIKLFRFHRIVLYGLFILTILLIEFTCLSDLYIYKQATTTYTNIEIVSPYISDQEYKALKSQFHLISNENDFDKLTLAIDNIAKRNSIELKK